MIERCPAAPLTAMGTDQGSNEHGDEVVREWFAAGQRSWPSLALGFEAFAAFCKRLLPLEDGLPIEPADWYLCCGCVEGLPEALRLFERHGLAVAQAAIRRVDADEEFVHDTLQELWSKLLVGSQPRVHAYSGRGPLQAWLRVAATRLALDRRRTRRRGANREVALSERLAASAFNPEAQVLKARYGNAFREALREAVAGLSGQERNVLRMHVGRCSIDDIGRAYGVHRATAARWIERARSKIYEQVRQILSAAHPLTDSEFRSLAGLMGAEVDLSLTQESWKQSGGIAPETAK
jgi:RNA polymerase sigma-70 factor, ECF subfamily